MTPIDWNRSALRPRRARTRYSTIAVLSIVLIIALAVPACANSRPSHPVTITMTASPATTHDQMLGLAGTLVGGPGNLADPSSGRLPNINAFRAAGIATLTVSDGTIRIVLRDDATPAQQQALLTRLRDSPLTSSITSTP